MVVQGEDRSGGERDVVGDLAGTRFLTVAEVASVLRVSRMTVYRLVHAGDMPAVRVGRSFRVPEGAVRAYLAGAGHPQGRAGDDVAGTGTA